MYDNLSNTITKNVLIKIHITSETKIRHIDIYGIYFQSLNKNGCRLSILLPIEHELIPIKC